MADDWTGRTDRSAYDGCSKTSASPLVFTHSPNAWRLFRGDSVLALAGHTHGGQINLPFIVRRVNAISLPKEYSYGFSKISGVDMFVGAGVGTSMLPIRFRAPPEIVIITLRAQRYKVNHRFGLRALIRCLLGLDISHLSFLTLKRAINFFGCSTSSKVVALPTSARLDSTILSSAIPSTKIKSSKACFR